MALARLQFTVLVKPLVAGDPNNPTGECGESHVWRADWLWSRGNAILCELRDSLDGKVSVDVTGKITIGYFGPENGGPEPYTANKVNGTEPRFVGVRTLQALLADPRMIVTPTVAPWPW